MRPQKESSGGPGKAFGKKGGISKRQRGRREKEKTKLDAREYVLTAISGKLLSGQKEKKEKKRPLEVGKFGNQK